MLKTPKLVIGLSTLLCIYSIFNIGKWRGKDVINWDTISYYSYLPATFIYKDLSLQFTDTNPRYYGNKFWPNKAPNGGKVIKTTMGLSVLYSPFFFLAHLYAKISGNETDGYSVPYHLFLALSASFYLFLGLYWIQKLLSKWFEDIIISITVLCLVFGTNLWCYTTMESTMSHTYNFALISCLIYFTIVWHQQVTWGRSIKLGLLMGLIVLVRPVNIIVVLFAILFGISDKTSFLEKVKLIRQYWKHLIVISVLVMLIFSPQLFYWKYITGQWFYNSYEGERFYFNNPHITEGLFGFRKGWFVYTPIMFLAVLSICLVWQKGQLKSLFFPILVFTIICIYVLLSWWCWWYGGGFGLRAFIDFYGIWSIPLAMLISTVGKHKPILKIVFAGVLIFLIALNCFQTYQYKKGIIHWDSMTKEEYFAVFGKLHYPPNADQLIKSPDYAKAKEGLD